MQKSKRQIGKQQSVTKPLSEIANLGPPKPAEIEVCVFGPSYGECIAAHLGNGCWIVVDSCLAETDAPAALEYLQAINVRPETAIKAVIATHWHDDHYKGLSQILRAAPEAHVCISGALTEKEFLKFATRMKKNKTAVAGVKLNEFLSVINEIRDRNARGLASFSFANVRKLLYSLPAAQSGHGHLCEVWALSPSDADILRFLERIALMMPQSKKTKISVSSTDPNEVSVVTLLKIGNVEVLLGADLENSGQPNAGLEGIITNHRAIPFGAGASLYKIGHHGSLTAYNRDIWNDLVVGNGSAVLTPWNRGQGRIPTRNGVEAILHHSEEAFITASEARSKRERRQRPPAVLRHLREHRVRLHSLRAPLGAVRFRMADHASNRWQVELFGDATHLRDLLRK